jgi:hypothetical protein
MPWIKGPRRKLFFDLADPEALFDDVRHAFNLISLQKYFMLLGPNEKRGISWLMPRNSLEDHPKAFGAGPRSCRLEIHTVAIHPVTYALAFSEGNADLVQGPHIPRAVITTGAGDHFNAGFCLGKLLNLDNSQCVLLGVAASGYYVRSGESPAIPGLVEMMRTWPAK